MQILNQHSSENTFLDQILFAMVNNAGGQFNRPTERDVLDLLIMCVGMVVRNGCIVLDAIDECADAQELLFDMKLL